MTRKFISTITDWVAVEDKFLGQFNLYNAKDEYEGNIALLMVENSNDWEEITEKPILVTKDDVVKYEGDMLYVVHSEDWSISKAYCSHELTKPPLNKIPFHEKQKAFYYIEDNKPRYSNEDLEWLIREVENLRGRASDTGEMRADVKCLIRDLKFSKND